MSFSCLSNYIHYVAVASLWCGEKHSAVYIFFGDLIHMSIPKGPHNKKPVLATVAATTASSLQERNAMSACSCHSKCHILATQNKKA